MKELNTGTAPSKYTLATRATLEQFAEERDKYKKALEQCLIVLCCMNDLSHIKRESKCIDIIEGAIKK